MWQIIIIIIYYFDHLNVLQRTHHCKSSITFITVLQLRDAETTHSSVFNSSTYKCNLLSITKQSCLEGKPTNETETLQRPKNRNDTVDSMELQPLLWSRSCCDSQVSSVSWWRGRMRGWHRGRVDGSSRCKRLCSPRPLSQLHLAGCCYDTSWEMTLGPNAQTKHIKSCYVFTHFGKSLLFPAQLKYFSHVKLVWSQFRVILLNT